MPNRPNPNPSTANLLDSTAKFIERRAASRIPVDDLCEMIIEQGQIKRTCLVHNFSSGGAMVETSLGTVPERFILYSAERGFRAACRVVWHCGGLAGVEFLTGVDLAKEE